MQGKRKFQTSFMLLQQTRDATLLLNIQTQRRGLKKINKARSSFFKLTPIFLLLDETIHKAFDIAPGGCIPNNQDDQMETTIQTPKNPWAKNCLPKPPIMKVQA